MTDKPDGKWQGRSRVVALILAVLVLYPLSFGPAHYLYWKSRPTQPSTPLGRTLAAFYSPVTETAKHFGVYGWLKWYCDLFPAP